MSLIETTTKNTESQRFTTLHNLIKVRTAAMLLGALALVILPSISFAGGLGGGLPRLHRSFLKQIVAARDCADRGEFSKAHAYTTLICPRVIKVSLDPSSERTGFTALANAIEMWNESLDGQTKLMLAPQSEAEVRISFGGSLVYAGQPCMASAVWTRTLIPLGWGSYEGRLSASISIRSDISGRACTAGELLHAAAHELGHILGLDDSPRPQDIMGPQVGQACPTAPAPEEVSAILGAGEDAHSINQICQTAGDQTSQTINFNEMVATPSFSP